jgi:hypothetical protein
MISRLDNNLPIPHQITNVNHLLFRFVLVVMKNI